MFLLTDYLIDYLTPSDKHNSINTKAMGLISSLFNVALSGDVPFGQPLQLQCSHHGSSIQVVLQRLGGTRHQPSRDPLLKV